MKFLTIFLFSFLAACGGSSTEEAVAPNVETTVQPSDAGTVPASNELTGDIVVTGTSETVQQVTTCADGSAPVNGVCPQTATGQVESATTH